MAARTYGLNIKLRADALTFDFGGNSLVKADLSSLRITDEQRAIIAKLARAKPEFILEECPGDDCPSAKHLTKEEFRKIRNLKASLGTAGELRAIICRFCLKCIRVPDR